MVRRSLVFACILLLAVLVYSVAAREQVSIDFSVKRNSIPPNFYGAHVGPFGGETSRIDTNNDGLEDVLSDYEAHRTAMEEAKITYLRRDMDLDNVANQDFTFNHYKNNPANIDVAKSQVAWAAATNKKNFVRDYVYA